MKRINNATLLSLASLLALTTYWVAAEQRTPPTEHKGLNVSVLGKVSEESLKAQIGLSGYVMQLRRISIAPGGTIARHGHKNRPGLVWTERGVWTEGRPTGESHYAEGDLKALVEDENTDHWFYNDDDRPSTAIVCDIVPAT